MRLCCLGFLSVVSLVVCWGCRSESGPAASAVVVSDHNDVDWAAIKKRHHVVQRELVQLNYQNPKTGGLLRYENDLVIITVTVEDIIEYRRCWLEEMYNPDPVLSGKEPRVLGLGNLPIIGQWFVDSVPDEPETPEPLPRDKLGERLKAELRDSIDYDLTDFRGRDRYDLEHGFAYLLRHGKAWVQLKDGSVCRRIFACQWSRKIAFSGAGGDVFFVEDGRQFFRVMDWIS